jgi:predicted CXXCH cytochrome family protein
MDIRITPRSFVIFFLLFTFLWIFTGCDKYSRYRALNFFFDGVPHPDKPQKEKEPASVKTAKAGQPKKAELPPETPRYKHPPAEGKDDCSFCHGPMNRMGLPPKDMCLKCHEHVKEKRPFIHGPAVVDCIVCHNVHESKTKTLLRKIGNSLCIDCHEKEGVQKAEPHKELKEEDLVCLSCHDPHGGKDRFFLK